MFLFDTNILSDVVKRNPSSALIDRLLGTPPEQQFTTAITIGEMVYGAYKSSRPDYYLESLSKKILPNITVLSFDEQSAYIYGKLRSDLEKKGTPIPEADLQIASIALLNKLTLITGNVKHFEKIPDLSIENWLTA